jgi:hypothetical protein
MWLTVGSFNNCFRLPIDDFEFLLNLISPQSFRAELEEKELHFEKPSQKR